MAKKRVDEIKEELTATPKAPNTPIPTKDFLGSGSTLLNLACSGKIAGAFAKGHYYFLVGDSSSGKTFLSLTMLAEAAINERFNDYRFIHDNPEEGSLMDFEHFFGQKMAQRLESTKSATVEDFYQNAIEAVKSGPCIYILDSMDALSANEDLENFNKKKKRKTSDDGDESKPKGSYGTAKAKANSAQLRVLHSELKTHGSILLVIGQTRQNIGFGAMFNPKTRSGGMGLTFYATLEIWSSLAEAIKRTVRKKARKIGLYVTLKIRKNRINGKNHTVKVPIYHSFGIDDIGSCVDYLVNEGYWSKTKGDIEASDFDITGTGEEVIRYIQQEPERERKLRLLVANVWYEIEEGCVVDRKSRY